MKNINKFTLTAVAVVSVVMILSMGIATAQQATVNETSSPLFKARTASALNAEKHDEVCALRFEEPRVIACTNCPAVCTQVQCTLVMKCTACSGCPVQSTPSGSIEMVAMRDGVRCVATECLHACSLGFCSMNCGACTACAGCPVQAQPGVRCVVSGFQ